MELILSPIAFNIAKHQDEIDRLVSLYDVEVMIANEIAQFFQQNVHRKTTFHRFFDSQASTPNFNLDLNFAVKELNSDYWSRLMKVTELMKIMPADRKSQWNKMIVDDKTAPMFTRELIDQTIAALTASQERFFAERIDGIFRKRSKGHITNCPEGFSKRMIFKDALENFDYGWINSSVKDYITDLRLVVHRIFNDDGDYHAFNSTTATIIKAARDNYGEWTFFDGGALKIKVFKNGNAHFEIHPEVAWQLNKYLHALHPTAIPSQFRTKPVKKSKEFGNIEIPIPSKILVMLDDAKHGLKKSSEPHKREYDRDIHSYGLFESTYTNYDKRSRELFSNIMHSIGGVRSATNRLMFDFDYDPSEVIRQILVMGRVPDDKSFQFYPTPDEIADYVVTVARIMPGDTVLEPSAGTGAIVVKLPHPEKVTAVELSKIRATALRSIPNMGEVIEGDFTKWNDDRQFDKIVMNPPFSDGRAQQHVNFAYTKLKSGGTLVAVVPTSLNLSFHSDDTVQDLKHFKNCFENTSITVKVVKITKR